MSNENGPIACEHLEDGTGDRHDGDVVGVVSVVSLPEL